MLVTAQSRVDEGLFPGTGRLVDDGMSAICDNGYELADVLFLERKSLPVAMVLCVNGDSMLSS